MNLIICVLHFKQTGTWSFETDDSAFWTEGNSWCASHYPQLLAPDTPSIILEFAVIND